jgi:hypothetical protein
MEEVAVSGIHYRMILLPQYETDLKKLKRLEPGLHDEIRKSIQIEIESGEFDEMPGTGGWVKGRAASPSRNIGKSGGFRFVYLVFRVQHDLYLQTIYDHRSKSDLAPDEKRLLKDMAEAYKRAYLTQKGSS